MNGPRISDTVRKCEERKENRYCDARLEMRADAFCVCYGLRWEVDQSNEDEVTQLELRQDPRQLAAKKHNLDSWWADTTDEGSYFLFVGKLIGNFGWEGRHSVRLEENDLLQIVDETNKKLRATGLEGTAALHFQFVPDK